MIIVHLSLLTGFVMTSAVSLTDLCSFDFHSHMLPSLTAVTQVPFAALQVSPMHYTAHRCPR